jgi:putative spermidine/putrescine transport system substrate-binding protein
MWRGDPSINAYVDQWVAPRLLRDYGVSLVAIEGQGPELVNSLIAEREARGDNAGATSLLWINGETFAAMRAESLLSGPWAHVLPNARYVDSASAIVMKDFEADPAGFESPWGSVQSVLVFDSARTPHPPRTASELRAWILAHPGRFTHDQGFTGVTFLKSLMYAVGGGVQRFAGGFREADYRAGRDSLFLWLDTVQRAFWRDGTTYPPDIAAMHRLFANREIDVTMTNNHREVAAKIRTGVLPATSRALILRDGAIANSHYVGIPFNAPNAAGAMVVANFLLSPEAQAEKAGLDVWGDGTVLDISRLPEPWPTVFRDRLEGADEISVDTLHRYARPEVAAEYHNRLLTDWRVRYRSGGL